MWLRVGEVYAAQRRCTRRVREAVGRGERAWGVRPERETLGSDSTTWKRVSRDEPVMAVTRREGCLG